jgi:hypothetical protein
MFTAWVAEGHVMLRTLRAEVERLKEANRQERELVGKLQSRVGGYADQLKMQETERDSLRATVAEQGAALTERNKDAERYRWLRNNEVHAIGEDFDFELRFRFGHLFHETLDKAIDAALTSIPPNKEKP